MAAEMTPALQDWLMRRRSELNQKFQAARRRFNQLQPADCLALCRKHLPAIAEPFTAATESLLEAVYDLLLLHAGRRLLGAQSSHAGLERLLGKTALALRPLLLSDPRRALPMLSNAVENLGAKGEAFLELLERLAPLAENVDELLDWGGLAAWRLGEARLRSYALSSLEDVPDEPLLAILQLDGWPTAAAPLARAACLHQGWTKPDEVVSPAAAAAAENASAKQLAAWTAQLASPWGASPKGKGAATAAGGAWKAAAALGAFLGVSSGEEPAPPAGDKEVSWRQAATVGEFVGFGGRFTQPPTLVSAGEHDHPHRFFVRSGDEVFRIDADVFGWVCRVQPDSGGPVLPVAKLGPAPTLADRPVTSWLHFGTVALCTTADSYRIRVLIPRRAPL